MVCNKMVTEMKKRICSPNGLNLVRLRRYSSHSAANRVEKLKNTFFRTPEPAKLVCTFPPVFALSCREPLGICCTILPVFCPFLQGPARPFLHYFARSPSDHLSLTICIPPKTDPKVVHKGSKSVQKLSNNGLT